MYRIIGDGHIMIKLIMADEDFRYEITMPSNITNMPEGQLWNFKMFLEESMRNDISIKIRRKKREFRRRG